MGLCVLNQLAQTHKMSLATDRTTSLPPVKVTGATSQQELVLSKA